MSEHQVDKVARFDPKTQEWVEFPLPEAESDPRRLDIDPTNPNRIFFSGNTAWPRRLRGSSAVRRVPDRKRTYPLPIGDCLIDPSASRGADGFFLPRTVMKKPSRGMMSRSRRCLGTARARNKAFAFPGRLHIIGGGNTAGVRRYAYDQCCAQTTIVWSRLVDVLLPGRAFLRSGAPLGAAFGALLLASCSGYHSLPGLGSSRTASANPFTRVAARKVHGWTRRALLAPAPEPDCSFRSGSREDHSAEALRMSSTTSANATGRRR